MVAGFGTPSNGRTTAASWNWTQQAAFTLQESSIRFLMLIQVLELCSCYPTAIVRSSWRSWTQVAPWVRQIDGSGYMHVQAYAVDEQGSSWVAGIFDGNIDLDPGLGTFTVSSPSDWGTFVVKLSNQGSFLWGRSYQHSTELPD